MIHERRERFAGVPAANDGALPRSIVIVEPEAPLALDLRSVLTRFGFDVPAVVASYGEALAAVDAHRPDLVVMDVGLEAPDDGIDAAAAIRSRHLTPIVFLGDSGDHATMLRAQHEASPDGYLLKPFREGDLRAAVELAMHRHDLELEVCEQRSLLAGVLGGMADAVVVADGEGRVVLLNEAARRLFGGDVATAWDLVTDNVRLADQETPCTVEHLPLLRALRGEVVHDSELFVRLEEEPRGRWLSMNATPLLDASGQVSGAVSVGRDVTDRHAARFELQQLALTDGLTGAYNRRGFMGVARDALDGAHRSGRRPALFFFDLNGMKQINDSFGHPEGDRLLTDVTSILRSCFRSSDVIGRLGGDEFVVLAPDAGEHAEALRARVHSAVESFNEGSSRPYRISVSIGLCADEPGRPARLEELVEQADKRMYEDKVRRASRRHSGKVPRLTLEGAHRESKRARSRHRP